jgi:hypothetical protein
MLLDPNNTAVEEFIGRLWVFEQQTQSEVKQVMDSLGQPMLCEEDWEARRKA